MTAAPTPPVVPDSSALGPLRHRAFLVLWIRDHGGQRGRVGARHRLRVADDRAGSFAGDGGVGAGRGDLAGVPVLAPGRRAGRHRRPAAAHDRGPDRAGLRQPRLGPSDRARSRRRPGAAPAHVRRRGGRRARRAGVAVDRARTRAARRHEAGGGPQLPRHQHQPRHRPGHRRSPDRLRRSGGRLLRRRRELPRHGVRADLVATQPGAARGARASGRRHACGAALLGSQSAAPARAPAGRALLHARLLLLGAPPSRVPGGDRRRSRRIRPAAGRGWPGRDRQRAPGAAAPTPLVRRSPGPWGDAADGAGDSRHGPRHNPAGRAAALLGGRWRRG